MIIWKKIKFYNCLNNLLKNASYGKTDNAIQFYGKNYIGPLDLEKKYMAWHPLQPMGRPADMAKKRILRL